MVGSFFLNSVFRQKVVTSFLIHGGRATISFQSRCIRTTGIFDGKVESGGGWGKCTQSRRRASSSPLQDPASEDQDLLKWEKMYERGQTSMWLEENDSTSFVQSEVRVVTFDLDNTLWRTAETISAANDALYDHMSRSGMDVPRRVEKVMKELFGFNRTRYCPAMMEENTRDSLESSSPVLLTQLRVDAIVDVCVKDNNFDPDEAEVFARNAFELWAKARHDAIPRHYAEDVVKCLEEIRRTKTSSGHPVIVGAITDGNSDPRRVPELEDKFDFVVNSESVGVAKPNRKVYTQAISEAMRLPALQDLFAHAEDAMIDEDVDEMVGPWWIHVGDDFMKDVVAAKELKMRCVWSTELLAQDVINRAGSNLTASNLAKQDDKDRNVVDLVKELSSMKVIEMTIGADDFLADKMQEEFVDAKIDSFSQLSGIISEWHSEGLLSTSPSKSSITPFCDTVYPSVADVLRLERMEDRQSFDPLTTKGNQKQEEAKFCMFCGTKLPKVAQFCLSCGEKQPELSL